MHFICECHRGRGRQRCCERQVFYRIAKLSQGRTTTKPGQCRRRPHPLQTGAASNRPGANGSIARRSPHAISSRKSRPNRNPPPSARSDDRYCIRLAHIRRAPPSARLRRRDERRGQCPFPISQITWISQAFTVMFNPSNTSPSHRFLHLLDKDG